MAINPHHLELFHYVVRHGGIAQASKNMPYGIGQSAISLQIARLESHLGVTLFRRRPFRLTPEGEKLHARTEPFFSTLERIETEFRGGAAPLLRIGATELIQRDHLPAVFDLLRAKRPDMRFALRDTDPAALAEMVRSGELDAAVCLYPEAPPRDLRSIPLLEVRPVLVVPETSPIGSAEEILSTESIRTPLICLQSNEPVCVVFREMLARKSMVWEPAFELGSLPIVHRYVLSGYGVGLSVSGPGTAHPGLRELPLPEARALSVAVIDAGNPCPMRDLLVEAARAHVESLEPAPAPVPTPGKPPLARRVRR